MTNSPLPMVLRSLAALQASPAAALPIQPCGSTYTMAQEAVWLDGQHYAVGRWDGTLSIFQFTASAAQGPAICKAVNAPAQEGLQMITALGFSPTFITSNDEQSMIVWTSPSGAWTDLEAAATLTYASALGVANSGAITMVGGACYFVAGHAEGYVSLWAMGATPTQWSLVTAVSVRSAHPVNPWGLYNVRGVAALPSDNVYGYVVTGSEDGNLTVVRVPDGAILSAVVYNPAAQRGINSIAINGDTLLVANCAVGPTDYNLWCYAITPGAWTIALTDKANLVVNTGAAQVFNFDVVWAPTSGAPNAFFCSTGEGALWMGQVAAGALQLAGYELVGAQMGAALCFDAGQLALTAYDLYEFTVTG